MQRHFLQERCTNRLDRLPLISTIFVVTSILLHKNPDSVDRVSYGYDENEWYAPIAYAFFHLDADHLYSNVPVLFVSGAIVEATEGNLRCFVLALYSVPFAAVGHAVTQRRVRVVGASGFVYATIAYQFALVFKNWSEMRVRKSSVWWIQVRSIISAAQTRVLVGILLLISEIIVSQKDSQTSHMAHGFGAVAGVLAGMTIGSNVRQYPSNALVGLMGCILVVLSCLVPVVDGQYLASVYMLACMPWLLYLAALDIEAWFRRWKIVAHSDGITIGETSSDKKIQPTISL